MIKRTLCLFLCILTVLCSLPITASADTSYTKDVSSVNGTRLTDYLVVYTSAYGSATATNIYGYEVTVVNGVVVSVGGNNNAIPVGSNSFVVSGHGVMKDWLSETIIPGMRAVFDRSSMKITFTKDSSTMLYALDTAASKANDAKQAAKEACLVYDKSADSRIDAAEALRKTASSMSESEIKALITEYEYITYLYREREVAEYRGVWLRPDQKNTSQVRSYVKQCANAGINMISIETMYAGTVIYPVPKGSLFEQNPIFNGFDVLGAFVDACHEYGIELHCWMPVFYSCNTANANYTRSVAYKKPEWRLLNNFGSPIYSYESSGMVFLNPANDEVQDFLAESYTYILETYDIDGFQLDYIRYRDRYDVDDFGYDEVSFVKFKKAYPKYKNSKITFDRNASYWNDWVNFRAQQVTNFVSRMRDIIDTVAPDVILSADVGVSVTDAYNTIYQDSMTWLENKWLDMIHPMAYGSGYSHYAERFLSAAGDSCMVVPGLGIFMEEFDGYDMAYQTDEMVSIGCGGVVFFQTAQYFGKGANRVLFETLYTEKALAPARDNKKTLSAIAERIIYRLETAESGGMLNKTASKELISLANEVLAAGTKNASSASEELKALDTAIAKLSDSALRTRLLLDVKNARFAVLRDSALFKLGDVNGNGEIEKYDYILVKRAVLKTVDLSGAQTLAADVNSSGDVEKYDYILIKRHVLKTYTIKG